MCMISRRRSRPATGSRANHEQVGCGTRAENLSKKNAPAAAPASPAADVKPLKPRRKLAAFLLVIFVVWIALLYVLYFTTVHGG